jgi:two-component system cell cycle response regulator
MTARILIIEDNAANLELMRYLLNAFGYEICIARDGAEGIARASEEMFDLVLCDVQMPGIDGYEVLRRLRADPRLAKIPVLAVTALAMVGDRGKVLAAGFDGYLAKPIDPASFVRHVESFLAESSRTPLREEDRSTQQSPQQRSRTKGTILALDNLQANLDLVASIFGSFGYRVITTREADEAARLAHASTPDLILSDVCMPNGSGYDFIRRVKSDPQLRDIPFVFITSTAATEPERQRGLALGATKFLFRPIEPQTLLEEIEECLAERGTS